MSKMTLSVRIAPAIYQGQSQWFEGDSYSQNDSSLFHSYGTIRMKWV